MILAPSPGCRDAVFQTPPRRAYFQASSHHSVRKRCCRKSVYREHPHRGTQSSRCWNRFSPYGVAFRDEQLDFWQLGFPSPPVDEEAPKTLTLECSGCRTPVTIEHGDYEFDVCTIHGGLVRYCDECAFATFWKFPSAASTAVSTAANAAITVERVRAFAAFSSDRFSGFRHRRAGRPAAASAKAGRHRLGIGG